MDIRKIAEVCHETNAAYCRTIGDATQKPWGLAEEWQRLSAIKGVEFALADPFAPASSQHDAWLRDKIADGWRFGPLKDPVKKEHPCCVAYEELPPEQRMKDYLFKAIVGAFREYQQDNAAINRA